MHSGGYLANPAPIDRSSTSPSRLGEAGEGDGPGEGAPGRPRREGLPERV